MDVKSTFLNEELEEEVYIEQPEGFLLSEKEEYVFILKKALYGIKPREHGIQYWIGNHNYKGSGKVMQTTIST